MVRAAGVVAAGRVDRVVLEHDVHAARVVHGDFHALDVDDVLLAALSDPLGGAVGALGQQAAERRVAVGDLVE